MHAGDTIYVRAGTYNESVTIAVSGSAAAGPVIFQSYPGETAIVDGTGLTPSTSDVQGLFNIEDESYVTIQGSKSVTTRPRVPQPRRREFGSPEQGATSRS